ncbi:hypothetical protein V493_00921 [Pseudogymnoascus sp. VKM F-4281 (FW-2241)]|nr:hypothetical protein V493_00921 [Pseudogymnoascus sp. VKM F-4281 (FW-2241)]
MVRRKARERGDGIHPPLGLYMVMDLPPDVEQCVKPHKASSAAQIGLRPQGINNVMIKSDKRSLEVSVKNGYANEPTGGQDKVRGRSSSIIGIGVHSTSSIAITGLNGGDITPLASILLYFALTLLYSVSSCFIFIWFTLNQEWINKNVRILQLHWDTRGDLMSQNLFVSCDLPLLSLAVLAVHHTHA